ncbi:hypothetical protein BGX38DRAFT_1224000 [Terfezia claveryi]|nr:hypothetical protein BGX38DRAFT_1224000 [Terfezia claveryi]
MSTPQIHSGWADFQLSQDAAKPHTQTRHIPSTWIEHKISALDCITHPLKGASHVGPGPVYPWVCRVYGNILHKTRSI